MRVAAAIAAVALLANAESRSDAPAVAACMREAAVEAWLRKFDQDLHALRYHALPETDFFEVGASKLELAMNELSERSFAPLDELLLTELCGNTYRRQDGKKPYLVRAVYGNTPAPFAVFSREGQLFIVHVGMRQGERWFRKSALIVSLPEPPKTVYVAADVASPH